jgi:hypothetical protein
LSFLASSSSLSLSFSVSSNFGRKSSSLLGSARGLSVVQVVAAN